MLDHHTQTPGKDPLGYRLTMTLPVHRAGRKDGKETSVLFEGEDFGNSPMHAIDSDATVGSLMGFLTLRPGDTDADYFDAYTPEQLAYCAHHAEALGCCITDRFGDR